jgi:hypothetical protein
LPRWAAPQQRRRDDVGIEHEPHQDAFFARRSARIVGQVNRNTAPPRPM